MSDLSNYQKPNEFDKAFSLLQGDAVLWGGIEMTPLVMPKLTPQEKIDALEKYMVDFDAMNRQQFAQDGTILVMIPRWDGGFALMTFRREHPSWTYEQLCSFATRPIIKDLKRGGN